MSEEVLYAIKLIDKNEESIEAYKFQSSQQMITIHDFLLDVTAFKDYAKKSCRKGFKRQCLEHYDDDLFRQGVSIELEKLFPIANRLVSIMSIFPLKYYQLFIRSIICYEFHVSLGMGGNEAAFTRRVKQMMEKEDQRLAALRKKRYTLLMTFVDFRKPWRAQSRRRARYLAQCELQSLPVATTNEMSVIDIFDDLSLPDVHQAAVAIAQDSSLANESWAFDPDALSDWL